MLQKPWMKAGRLAVAAAVALMLAGVAQAQTGGGTGPDASGAGSGTSAGSGMGVTPETSGASGAASGKPDAYGAGTGAAANSSGSSDTMKGSRRSRATVTPNIINDSTYPDPAAGVDTGASKARRDAKRAARAPRSGAESGGIDLSPSYPAPMPGGGNSQ